MALSAHRQSHLYNVSRALLLFLSFVLSGSADENQPNNRPDADGWIYNHTKAPLPGLNEYGQIRCFGLWPESRREFGDAHVGPIHSLLELCAEPGYGGLMGNHPVSATNNGALCAWWLPSPRVVISREIQSRGSISWKRELLCQTKCACENIGVAPHISLAGWEENRQLEYVRGDHGHTYIFAERPSNSLTELETFNNIEHPIPLYLSSGVFSERYRGVDAPEPAPSLMRKTTVSGLVENELNCSQSEMPNFPLFAEYRTLKELCSANFLGGHPSLNVGGICVDARRNLVQYREEFANPIYSRSLVSWGGWQASSTLVTLYWCMTSCVCAAPDFKGKVRKPTTKIRGHGEVTKEADGSLTVRLKNKTDRSVKVFKLTGRSDTFSASTAKHCALGRDGEMWCFADLGPGELEAPPMYGPKDIFSHLDRSQSVLDNLGHGECGDPCQQPTDCDGGCGVCMIDQDAPDSVSEYYDPLAGRVLRHAISAVCASIMIEKLGGRAATRPRVCACNGTYLSTGCCGSEDGMIWELRDYQWGDLRV